MKKTTHSLLISALILFCTGLLLAVVTSLYAKIAKIEVYDVPKKAKTIETISVSIDEILKHSPESNYVKQLSETKFAKIDLSSFVGDVIICQSDKAELQFNKANTNNLSYIITGDTLTVEEVDPVGFMGFYISRGGISFKGLRHIFNPGNPTNGAKTITIKIPKEQNLTQIDIYSSIGDITIDGISSSNINVESGNGDVIIKNLSNPEGKITVNGNFTDVKMEKNLYYNCVVSTHFGNIETKLPNHANASTILDLWCGDIDVETNLPATHYKLSLTTTLGMITRNSEDVGKKLNSDGSGAARISSDIFLGDFNLEFSDDDKNYKPEQTIS